MMSEKSDWNTNKEDSSSIVHADATTTLKKTCGICTWTILNIHRDDKVYEHVFESPILEIKMDGISYYLKIHFDYAADKIYVDPKHNYGYGATPNKVPLQYKFVYNRNNCMIHVKHVSLKTFVFGLSDKEIQLSEHIVKLTDTNKGDSKKIDSEHVNWIVPPLSKSCTSLLNPKTIEKLKFKVEITHIRPDSKLNDH